MRDETTDGDPYTLRPDHAPTPFTADQIRDGCPAGRQVRLLIETAEAEPHVRVWRFVAADGNGALQRFQRFDLDGSPLDDPTDRWASWTDLQSHASFPAAHTVVDTEEIDLPFGRFDCLRYTVSQSGTEQVFWFARSLPGMPVRMTSRTGDSLVFAMTMLESSTP